MRKFQMLLYLEVQLILVLTRVAAWSRNSQRIGQSKKSGKSASKSVFIQEKVEGRFRRDVPFVSHGRVVCAFRAPANPAGERVKTWKNWMRQQTAPRS